VILRPRQKVFVDRCLAALAKSGDPLGVAPTGAGKTVMLSAIGGQLGRTLVLQHREELVRQNRRTWVHFNVKHRNRTTVYARWQKRWVNKLGEPAPATFAMQPTLCRPRHLETMPAFDAIIIDECHHATAPTYRRIVDHARELNPSLKLLGVTATPNRGDRARLSKVFSNLADQISIGELIGAGHLVPPRAFVIDAGVSRKLSEVRKTRGGEYDLGQAAELLDVEPVTDQVIAHWRDKASGRKTVVFTGTCSHAAHVSGAFVDAGVKAAYITGATPKGERAAILKELRDGDLQVLVNVAVATEGWDCPPVSCVVLLRPSSYHSTMIQMIGRGLRTLDPTRHSGVKTDCVVLDFGRSILTHGGIEQMVDLRPHTEAEHMGEGPKKECPGCGAMIPLRVRQCPLCSHQWPAELHEVTTLEEFQMVELDLLIQNSPYRWWQYNSRTRVVTAFDVWAVAFADTCGIWHCFGGRDGRVEYLMMGTERVTVGAGDDWMRQHGDSSLAGKNRQWLTVPPSDKQLAHIRRWTTCPPVRNRYEAACAMTLRFNRARILRAFADRHRDAA